ncbi:DUF3990 domain-containing protein [Lacrimispora saccharolytica]|nr:DUF3990 domain-containing protein [Lacrimispora saccharolytica]
MRTVYHGSDHVLKSPKYQCGKADNDYGNGFYTTEYEDRAKSWAALNGVREHCIVNEYDLDMTDLEVMDLNAYGVLAWIAEVVANRGMNQEAANIVGERLIKLYRVDSKQADIITGYRADDSYTQVIEAFLLNQLNVEEVKRLFYKGSLGNQIFLKSEKAFQHIIWKNAYEIKAEEVDVSYDLTARREVSRFLQERMKAILLDGYQVPGITAQYAIRHHLVYHREEDYYEAAGI